MSKEAKLFPIPTANESGYVTFDLPMMMDHGHDNAGDDRDNTLFEENVQSHNSIKHAKWGEDLEELALKNTFDDDLLDLEVNVTPLLQYDPPFLSQKPPKAHSTFKGSSMFQSNANAQEFNYMEKHHKLKCTERPLDEGNLEELLDLIKPPLEFQHENGQLWRQRMSKVPVKSVSTLEDQLDYLLDQRRVRMRGICPNRRHLYEDCFDELLRQIALDTPERAILLIRCRQELEQRVKVYTHLLQGVEAYIMRQSVLDTACRHSGTNQSRLQASTEENRRLRTTHDSLLTQVDRARTKQREEQETMDRKHEQDLTYYKTMNIRLKAQLDLFMDPSRMYKKIAQPIGKTQKSVLNNNNGAEDPPPPADPKKETKRSKDQFSIS